MKKLETETIYVGKEPEIEYELIKKTLIEMGRGIKPSEVLWYEISEEKIENLGLWVVTVYVNYSEKSEGQRAEKKFYFKNGIMNGKPIIISQLSFVYRMLGKQAELKIIKEFWEAVER